MQDGARCHTSSYSLQFLDDHVPILLAPELWPPQSPDINLLDYGMWDILETKVWSSGVRAKTLEGLRARISQCWRDFPQEIIDKTIDAFRTHVRKVIEVNCGHIERFL